jgi:trehalose 6-phosphate synthase
MLRWSVRDLDERATRIVNSVQASAEEVVHADDRPRMREFLDRMAADERLYAAAYCASPTAAPVATAQVPKDITCSAPAGAAAANEVRTTPHGPLLVSVRPLPSIIKPDGQLVLVQDMGFVARRSEETRRYLFYFFIGLGATVSLITVIIAQISWRGWVRGLQALMQGEGLWRPAGQLDPAELRPIATGLRALIKNVEAEHRSRDHDRLTWNPDALREILHAVLRGQDIIVVSNREPYIHMKQDGAIAVQRPASGLVAALEPIMRACSGTWIAHGSGSADREVVDKHDRVSVPVDHPAYQLRRVWLTPEEEAGYYYGFANEGLWPLCHIAHVRPTFRTKDWEHYVTVNRRFARAVIDEANAPNPVVLVQDYHFALLPRMIREALPDATIITFWHIPWPNPEVFAICPWREELLDGLLGSSILGFHTQFHCNNFVDTVDRLLEARADREMFTVSYKGSLTAVKRYPISVEWPPAAAMAEEPVDECHRAVCARHKLPLKQKIGVGVDRLDYTKGIEERFRSVERLLEIHPEWVGKFTFIQIAAPTRASIGEYARYAEQVRATAARINARFAGASHPPIVLKLEHHEPHEVYEYYRAADVCFVSSLHDGMNLVAKEFVSARDDERGVLVLSQFTGAARDLPEAIIVNPYDMDECAEALHAAITMPAAEQRERMRLMRGFIQEFNVYRWAGRMLIDAATMRRRSSLFARAIAPVTRPRRIPAAEERAGV